MSRPNTEPKSSFRVTPANEATSLTDGAELANGVVLPWAGYGTYKVGKLISRECTLEALRQGYRCIDTAFIYGGETTEKQVGLAIQDAVSEKLLLREDLVVVTKHWRKYHGYEPTMTCLGLSMKRLQLDYIDLWLMHWPGPAWKTMNRRKDAMAENGPWFYAAHSKEDMPHLRSETWRAMEDAVKAGKVKSIGVSNFSIAHLERLKKTATIWPPAVNQIECHPLYPQTELLEYCVKEGIVVQAYASLGGQDAGKAFWKKVYKKTGKEAAVTKLLNTPPVLGLAKEVDRTPAQVLLRWALEKNAALVPKSSTPERMAENSDIFDFSLSPEQVLGLETQLQQALSQAAETEQESVKAMGRLCWRSDPLRLLEFD
jgi:diketogulonate reductase-like aldo/keto reductase